MQSEGYYGPVGIDAMQYKDDAGEVRMRVIQDVNARWTMGRLAAAWRRYLPPNVPARWLLSADAADDQVAPAHRLATSPTILDGSPLRAQMELQWG
jgi:hypothetical protein